MNIAVLHLSDIHIEGSDDLVLKRAEQICSALRSIETPFQVCLIAITGDVAFSGESSQYEIAEKFLSQITSGIIAMNQTAQIFVAVVPGNHDCNFKRIKPDLHSVLIQGVTSTIAELKADSGVVEELLELQEEFFEFESKLTRGPKIPVQERLFWVKEFCVDELKLRINCYNTAWISQKKEKQGELYFPMKAVDEEKMSAPNGDLYFSLFHHPYGWLQFDNGLAFENLVDRSSDIVLTGHEHVEKYTHKHNITGEETSYSKGSVLQEGTGGRSGFNILLIDLKAHKQKVVQHAWKQNRYARTKETDWFNFIRNRALARSLFDNSPKFAAQLKEVGANFTHKRVKRDLTLGDLFIYPDFSDRSLRKNLGSTHGAPKLLRGENLVEYVVEHKDVLIVGGDLSGKTSLAKVLYSDLKALKNRIPVLVSGDELDGPAEEKLRKSIGRAFSKQYSPEALESFEQLASDNRVLIIDDFNKSKFKTQSREH
jgi:hypothetical protein